MMSNKCSGCGANLPAGERVCPYCGAVQEDNSNQALLDELMILRRRLAIADAQNDRIALRELLADEFAGNEIDGGEPNLYDKKIWLEREWSDKYFFSYGSREEKLLERTNETAIVSCVEIVCRHPPKGIMFPDGEQNMYWRSKINYIRRNGRWLIAALEQTTIDENGDDIT